MKSQTLPAEVQLDDLEQRGAFLSPLELKLPESLDMSGWAEIGRKLCRADQVMQWWLGDWAAFGLRKFEGVNEGRQKEEGRMMKGEQRPRRGALKEFAEANGINYQTLRNLAWVSSKVEMSRRRDKVEWSKHAEVAALPERDQSKWLAKAESENLPRSELRQQIRISQGENNALVSDGPATVSPRKFVDDLVGWIRKHPAESLVPEQRGIWRETLRPVVEFYEALDKGN